MTRPQPTITGVRIVNDTDDTEVGVLDFTAPDGKAYHLVVNNEAVTLHESPLDLEDDELIGWSYLDPMGVQVADPDRLGNPTGIIPNDRVPPTTSAHVTFGWYADGYPVLFANLTDEGLICDLWNAANLLWTMSQTWDEIFAGSPDDDFEDVVQEPTWPEDREPNALDDELYASPADLQARFADTTGWDYEALIVHLLAFIAEHDDSGRHSLLAAYLERVEREELEMGL